MDLLVKAKPVDKIAGRGGIVTFRRNTRAAVRGLWTGALNKRQALLAFRRAIELAIEKAWLEGAAECGIKKEDLSVEELTARDAFIFEQNELAANFIDRVEKESKSNGGKLTPLLQQNEVWLNQYAAAKQQSTALSCGDEKREWRVGRTEHCKTCLTLNGVVKRLSFWESHVLPRNAPNNKLACGGWRCQCALMPTRKPVSRGPLPLGL